MANRMTNSSNRLCFVVLDASDEVIRTERVLQSFDAEIRIFRWLEEFRLYIERPEVKVKNDIILITSGSFGLQLKTDLENDRYAQIGSIYLLCQNKGAHQRWASTIDRVKGVVTSLDELIDLIQRNHLIKTSLSVQRRTEKDLHLFIDFSVDSNYFVTRILIEHFTSMIPNENEKQIFANILAEFYSSSSEKAAVVARFHQNYSSDHPIEWLLRDEKCLEILSNAFKSSNGEALLVCAFLFRDLMKQFQRIRCTTPVETYHGRILSFDDLGKWIDHREKFVVCRTFFSTTRDEQMALTFAENENRRHDQRPVLFTVRANPNTKGVLPFISSSAIGSDDEQEVVFSIGSMFRVDSVECSYNRTVQIQLTLCVDDENVQHQTFFEKFHQRYIENGRCNFTGLMRLFVDMSADLNDSQLMSVAENCITAVVSNSPNDDREMIDYFDLLATIEQRKQNWDASISWHQRSIDMREKIASSLRLSLSKSYRNIEECFSARGALLKDRENPRETSTTDEFVQVDQVDDEGISLDSVSHHIDYLHHRSKRSDRSSSNNKEERKQMTIGLSLAHMYKDLGTLYQQYDQNDKARASFQKAASIYRAMESANDRK